MKTRPEANRRTLSRHSGRQRGFTLLEILLAMVFLSVALLALAQLIVVALEHNKFAEFNTKAVQVARMKVEALRGQFSDQIESGTESADLTAGQHGPESITLQHPDNTIQSVTQFDVTWTIIDTAGGSKSVAVTVIPPTSDVRLNKTVTLTSHFAP